MPDPGASRGVRRRSAGTPSAAGKVARPTPHTRSTPRGRDSQSRCAGACPLSHPSASRMAPTTWPGSSPPASPEQDVQRLPTRAPTPTRITHPIKMLTGDRASVHPVSKMMMPTAMTPTDDSSRRPRPSRAAERRDRCRRGDRDVIATSSPQGRSPPPPAWAQPAPVPAPGNTGGPPEDASAMRNNDDPLAEAPGPRSGDSRRYADRRRVGLRRIAT